MYIACGGGCGVKSNGGSLLLTLGAKFTLSISCSCGCCWQDKLVKVGACLWVDLFCPSLLGRGIRRILKVRVLTTFVEVM